MTSFRDPEKDPLGTGYQLLQSFYAIGSGGLFGKGLNNSYQKLLYMTYGESDFIFAILCEEFGVSEAQLLIDPDNQHRLFYTYVCSDIGIGRFVMGLLGEVEVVSGPSLKQYIQEQIKQYAGQEN